MADRIIDCTGNADVAYYSGAKCRKICRKKSMGITQVFNVSGIDKDAFLKYTEKKKATYGDWGCDDWCDNELPED